MTNEILTAEARLMLLKYGYKQVLKAIASSQGATLEEVEAAIDQLETNKIKKGVKTHKTAIEVLDSLGLQRGHHTDLLREIARLYESRTFLPTLRDVALFLRRQREPDVKLKSRREALSLVLRSLAKMDDAGLRDILEELRDAGRGSDYLALAHEIMCKGAR